MPDDNAARVLSVSRHYVDLLLSDGSVAQATLTAKTRDTTLGDMVSLTHQKDGLAVTGIHPRKNRLQRSYGGKTKQLGANLDMLFIVTAPEPLFHTVAIDRMIAAATIETIPITLLFNKVDVDEAQLQILSVPYRALGFNCLLTSVKKSDGLDKLNSLLLDRSLQNIALCGISGVGKSSILNHLIPKARARIGALSDRSGMGKQTTSQARAHQMPRPEAVPLLIIDLPGIQFFGVSHLSVRECAHAFVEIARLSLACDFSDCSHRKEPRCAVKAALAAGEIAASRYESYLGILEEIEAAKPY